MTVTRPDNFDALQVIRDAGHTPGTQEAEDHLTTMLHGDREDARTWNRVAEQAAQLEEKGFAVHGDAAERTVEERIEDLQKQVDDLEATAGELLRQQEADRAAKGSPIRSGLDTDADTDGFGPGDGMPGLEEPDEDPRAWEDYDPGPEVDDEGGMSEISPMADEAARQEEEYFGGFEAGR